MFSKWNEYHCRKNWTCLLFWLKKRLGIPQWGGNIYLFVPLQQDRAAVFWRPLEAFVDVFHQQVHAVFVERLHAFLDVTALEGAEHLQHQTLRTVLARREQTAEGQSRYTFQLVRIPGCKIIDHCHISQITRRHLDREMHTPWKVLSYKVLKICYFLLYCLSLESLRRTKYYCYTTNQESKVSQSDALKCAGTLSFTDQENRAHLDVLVLCVDWWVLQYCM